MNKTLHIILFLCVWLGCSTCIDEYSPELKGYDNLLVVDGFISDQPGPYTVTLSRSVRPGSSGFIPETDAEVKISDKQGNEVYLAEQEDGIYLTPESAGFRGVPGKKYRIEIKTINGSLYVSDFAMLMPSVEIDRVYAELESVPAEDEIYDLRGYQFYMNTKESEGESRYFMMLLSATYEYQADFKVRFYYNGNLRQFPNPDSLKTCWRTYTVQNIFTASTEELNTQNLERFPLHFVDTETRELFIRYSLQVSMFTLSKQNWEYWDKLRELQENQDGLFTRQPYQVRGNVVCVSNPDEIVLGEFTVAGITEKRIFVDRPPFSVQFHFPVCEITEVDVENFGMISLSPPNTWPVYATSTSGGAGALPPQECMDCRQSGGTIVKPEFWIDE